MGIKGVKVPKHKAVPFAGITPAPVDAQPMFISGNWRYIRPVYKDKLSPCALACSADEKIALYLELAKKGKFQEAYQVIMRDNSFPGTCGRVCYHQCEASCNRKDYDEPLAIHLVERFLGDFGLKHAGRPKAPAKRRQRVAIVGAGPAGLSCAYHLAGRGYRVTIFEASTNPGGMLTQGIPKYRLPREVIDGEIDNILSSGIEIKTGVRVGDKMDWQEVFGFDAAFIATGLHKNRALSIEGEKARGVSSGVEFLRRVNEGQKVDIAGKVAIIGGGNTAVDAARTSFRLGAKPTIIYRRSRQEMTAHPAEIEEAQKEGIEILYLTAPLNILAKDGVVVGLEAIKMRLGEKDASGRPRPEPIGGSNFNLKFDRIIAAIGEEADTSCWPKGLKIEKSRSGELFAPTNRPGVLVGGDVATGLGTVIDAIGSGKMAASAIGRYLSSEAICEVNREELTPIGLNALNLNYHSYVPRLQGKQIEISRRRAGFHEVNIGYSAEDVAAESDRCFSCGVCNSCDNCWVFCPDACVIKDGRPENKYSINLDYCKGCMICAHECPTGSISRAAELDFEDGVIRLETVFGETQED